ncbi:hypothetical protein RF11_08723 [Thelohanellus kitauei]|uniref:Uncharacterized protein n=1 Tax=Thelohanellus kitauei TaxID=669202 RepID=A0A0C2MQ13_THEKT|nr:hypothetical protein RF11_08723 [Thelohanellus kitauei]
MSQDLVKSGSSFIVAEYFVMCLFSNCEEHLLKHSRRVQADEHMNDYPIICRKMMEKALRLFNKSNYLKPNIRGRFIETRHLELIREFTFPHPPRVIVRTYDTIHDDSFLFERNGREPNRRVMRRHPTNLIVRYDWIPDNAFLFESNELFELPIEALLKGFILIYEANIMFGGILYGRLFDPA